MKSAFPVSNSVLKWSAYAFLVGFLIISSRLCAQEAVPAELASPTNPGLTQHEIEALQGQPEAPAPAVSGQQLAETPRRLHYGVTVTVRGIYDDNINISNVVHEDDYYFSIEPSVFFRYGDDTAEGNNAFSFIYRPQIFLFVNNSENDAVQHLIRVQANHNFGRLTVALSQDVQILDGADLNSLSDPTGHNANIDVGQRARHNIYTTQISDSYDLTGKLFLSNSIGLYIDDYEGSFIDSRNIYGNLFINYRYSDKLSIGLGGTAGYNPGEQGNPDQTYEQANVRANYAATAKVSVTASAGVEFRQFENDTRGTYVTPVFDLGASYQPFDGTAITLSGNRRVQNSASLGGQDYTTTNIHLAIAQRFLRRFSLGLAVGYENSEYFSTFQGVNATRSDDYYYVQPSIDATIARWWTAGGYYLYRQNSSSLSFFSFDDNQVGFRTTFTF